MTRPPILSWPTRRCYVCQREHTPSQWAVVVLRSPIALVEIDAWLCSRDCEDTLIFDAGWEVDPASRLGAIKEMCDGL